MDNFKKELKDIENGIENAHREIEYHEKQVSIYRENYNELSSQWVDLISKKQVIIVFDELKRLLELLKIKDKDPQLEFLEYLRCVLVEHDCQSVEDYVNDMITDKFGKEKLEQII